MLTRSRAQIGGAAGTVNLTEVSRIERSETKPYCLLVETKGARKFYLNLNSDSEVGYCYEPLGLRINNGSQHPDAMQVVDWQDDIYSRTPLRGGDPTDFKHLTSATFDINSGQFVVRTLFEAQL